MIHSRIKLAIADDCEKFRKAVVRLVHMKTDFKVIIEAENGQDLLDQLWTATPDVILMDIRMPIMDGMEATNQIKKLYPNLKIITFSQYDQEQNIIEMNIQGVKSFIGKEDEPEELFRAIRIVNEGGVYMTDRSAKIVQRYLSNKHQRVELPELNDFQRSLIRAICEGQSSTEIGRNLNKSHRTIEEHRENLYKKFGVRTKEGFLREVYRRNWS